MLDTARGETIGGEGRARADEVLGALQERSAIGAEASITFERSLSGCLPAAVLRAGDAELRAALFGAHVFGCKLQGAEVFYMSPQSVNDGTKPLRGGSPLVGPWFRSGPDNILHGVLRTAEYRVVDAYVSGALARLDLGMLPNELTQRHLPRGCAIDVSITLDPCGTTTEISVDNRYGLTALRGAVFGFHDYYLQSEAPRTEIRGLTGGYRDDMASPPGNELRETQDPVRIEADRGTSRFYHAPEGGFSLHDPQACRTIHLMAGSRLPRAYLWNPAGRANMADLPPAEHRKFVCLELMSAETDIAAGARVSFARRVMLEGLA